MSDLQLTDQQSLAVHSLDDDVLVTAAAGAGKTAVLAQRCVYLLTEAPRPCDVTELLVLTYTEAAAAQMRRRISGQLRQKVAALPQDARVRRQLALLDKAAISTVHAFCGAVLREFFYRLPLDPAFEILDADEADLLKLQVAAEVFEENYARLEQPSTTQDFSNFVQSYGSAAGDRPLVQLLISLHNFFDTLADHNTWISNWQSQLGTIAASDVNDLAVVRRQKQILQRRLDRVIAQLHHALETITIYQQLDFYTDYINGQLLRPLIQIRATLDQTAIDDSLDAINELTRFPNAPTRPRELSDNDIQPVKGHIDRARKNFNNLSKNYAVAPADVLRQITATAPHARMLIELYENFVARYEHLKQRQNTLDFADLEHKCLALLRGEPQGAATPPPSDVARQLRDRFRYILVDEYQDISPIQEAIIQYISKACPDALRHRERPPGNLFMVGDVKQSIYAFRQADPKIFMKKYDSFAPVTAAQQPSAPTTGKKRIDLNKNFRSRHGVIAAINYIFSRCMTRNFAGIAYEKSAQLVYGADFYDADASGGDRSSPNSVELHLVEKNLPENHHDQSFPDASRREAAVVAHRIARMVGADQPSPRSEFDILDPQTGQARPVQYRDIVILMRSMKNQAELWHEVFHQMGIPAHAELTAGYFGATEIQDMLCLLKLLDNLQQDIPLASVLRSPLVGLDESQLTAIRLHLPRQPYHHAVCRYAEDGPQESLRTKLRRFFDLYENWRRQARRGSLAQLIWQIYRDTNLLVFVAALPNGKQRRNNLLHLHDRARQFDRFNYQGLARFLKFIEKLREDQGDFGPAPVLTEADNVVRIMSIHKSKGLEFPVVIIAQLARDFNKTDCRQSILFDRTETSAMGLRLVDPDSRERWPTVAHQVVSDAREQQLLAEEMRILYVALTRVRERLILSATIDLDKSRAAWRPWRFNVDKPLPEFLLSAATAPIDWLGPALAGHPDLQSFLDDQTISATIAQGAPPEARFKLTTYDADCLRNLLADSREPDSKTPLPEPPRTDPAFSTDALTPGACSVIDRINWRYPLLPLIKSAARTSVTELKRPFDVIQDPDFARDRPLSLTEAHPPATPVAELPDPFRQRPRFLSDQPHQPAATEKGTWTHAFLQRLSLEEPLDEPSLAVQLDALVKHGFLADQQARHIDLPSIARLFASPLGRQIVAQRRTLHREWPFTLAVPVAQVYPDAVLDNVPPGESVLVRGIIDLFFQTEPGIVIVDYKTDDIPAAHCEQRSQAYATQMLLYRQAVQNILKCPVAQALIYFLNPAVTTTIPLKPLPRTDA